MMNFGSEESKFELKTQNNQNEEKENNLAEDKKELR